MVAMTVGMALLAGALQVEGRPNILYIYVDDMGWGAIGPNGQDARRAKGLPSAKTPSIDSLATAGINFRRGYGCMVCSPARSSSMTGFHQGHTYADRNDPDNAKKAMRREDVTLGDALKAAGYATGYWGKWGFGGSKEKTATPVIQNRQTLPNSHGFEDVLAELHHVRAHTFFQPTLWSCLPGDADLELIKNNLSDYESNADYPERAAHHSHPDYPDTAYCDDYYAFRALDFVRKNAQQYNKDGTPFLACFCPQIPHAPFKEVAKLPEWDAEYKDDAWFRKLSPEGQQWVAMVTRIDTHIGNILAALEDPNGDGDTSDSVADDTLVIFQSDNGGAKNSGIKEMDANAHLRENKGSIYEGGIRVPMLMRWPAMIHGKSALRAGTSSDKVIDATDFLPTFCELAGVEAPLGIDGMSQAAFLMGADGGRTRDFVIHEAGKGSSIIRGNMKLVKLKKSLELYDLAADPSEKNDISASNPELVEELTALLEGERVDEPKGFANTYHDWTGKDGASTAKAGNWSDYVYKNEVNGIVYHTDDGAPQVSWVAKMHNKGSKGNTAVARADLELLALELAGKSPKAMQILEVKGCTVTGRNEIRLKPFAKVMLMGGTLASLRHVDLLADAILEGTGTIDAALYHAGRLAVTSTMAVTGDYHASSGAKLDMILGGNNGTQVKIDGEASLAGTLSVTTAPGFAAKKGDRFRVLTAGKLTGKFANPNGQVVAGDGTAFSIDYADKAVVLTVAAATKNK